MGAEELAAEMAVEGPDDGAHEEDEEEEDRIGPEHEDGGKGGLADADDAHENNVLNAKADGLEIGGHAADDAADFHRIEKGGGEVLEVGEDGVADVADDEFAEFEGEEDAVAEIDLRKRGQGGEKGGAENDAVKVAVGDGAVDDRAEDMSQQGKLDGADGCEDAEEEDDAAMGNGVEEHPPHEAEELERLELDVAFFVAGDVSEGGKHGESKKLKVKS